MNSFGWIAFSCDTNKQIEEKKYFLIYMENETASRTDWYRPYGALLHLLKELCVYVCWLCMKLWKNNYNIYSIEWPDRQEAHGHSQSAFSMWSTTMLTVQICNECVFGFEKMHAILRIMEKIVSLAQKRKQFEFYWKAALHLKSSDGKISHITCISTNNFFFNLIDPYSSFVAHIQRDFNIRFVYS